MSGVEGQSGPRAGAAGANEGKRNKWHRRRARRVQDKIAKLAEGRAVSVAILQNLNKALANLRKGEDQVNMELTEHAEPGQSGSRKEQKAAAPVSLIGDTWNFVNMGIEVKSTPEVELPQPPG